MAKTLSKSTPIKVTIGLLIVVGLAVAGMSAGWVDHNSDIKAIGVKADTIKTGGCDPAKKSVTDVAVIKRDVAAIEEDVREIRIEQKAESKARKADTTAIIKAINEKK